MLDLELQSWLVEQLPEGLAENPLNKGTFVWKDSRWPNAWNVVTDREWDCIVRRVEQEPWVHWTNYAKAIYELDCPGKGIGESRIMLQASWQTRTRALMSLHAQPQPLPKHLWVQYAKDDPENASVMQTADSEDQAREDDDIFQYGLPWYRYDIAPGGGPDGALGNPNGPHYFSRP